MALVTTSACKLNLAGLSRINGTFGYHFDVWKQFSVVGFLSSNKTETSKIGSRSANILGYAQDAFSMEVSVSKHRKDAFRAAEALQKLGYIVLKQMRMLFPDPTPPHQ